MKSCSILTCLILVLGVIEVVIEPMIVKGEYVAIRRLTCAL